MKQTTDRQTYVNKAAKYASQVYNQISTEPEYLYCHESFAVADALLAAEEKFPDLGTFGVEYIAEGGDDSPSITYLNTGDTYDLTVLYVNGRFQVGCWGDIVESGNYA